MCALNAKPISAETSKEKHELKRDEKPYFEPREFSEVFDLSDQIDNEALIEETENLRFIYGRQGQVGIEYWDNYDEGRKADSVIFINNSDARKLLEFLDCTINHPDFGTPKMPGIKYNLLDKYEIVIFNNSGDIFARLYKTKNQTDVTCVDFSNHMQIGLFHQFLTFHLN